jgi:hypothetical protein
VKSCDGYCELKLGGHLVQAEAGHNHDYFTKWTPLSVEMLTDTVDGNTSSSSSSPPLVGVPQTSSPDVAAEVEHSSPDDVVLGSGGESPQDGCC